MQAASIIVIQHRFRIGYTIATKVIDRLEENGVIRPNEGSNPRGGMIKH
ncbi:hypothetical protein FC676_18535 [Bacillus cereus]|nr:DNA translocase FtsK [Bacillus cereus]TKH70537.1 hypothetical protein FC676_18535 [Bacillus cereus]